MSNSDKKQVLYCSHCGNTSVQTKLIEQDYLESYYSYSDGKESKEPSCFTVTRCETCSGILVYSKLLPAPEETWSTLFGEIVYPQENGFNMSIPQNIRKVYQEALKVKNASPTAFVILARRVLEEICKDKSIKSNNLSQALEKLSAQGEIPKILSEAISLIRLVGNAGAHSTDIHINLF
ncbi:MAG: DUF4145 domain-containing protein [Candidatus Aureabacteria bacterium]|nr:DUF4145 domain-containing protein [Candidatus Auribacterota bacterium]